jgi:hypothetical protein
MTANPPPVLPPAMEPLRTELGVYYRELPRLLEERQEGKYLVVKGEKLHGVWDTSHDAYQFVLDKFGEERVLIQKIDRRFLAALAPVFGPHPAVPLEGD